ncbi:MAG: hypothetical protein P4L42_09510 [Desulfocapsaceae bacterium]|nr:hypothetical protein [Desulfocapsaceae bacterium]
MQINSIDILLTAFHILNMQRNILPYPEKILKIGDEGIRIRLPASITEKCKDEAHLPFNPKRLTISFRQVNVNPVNPAQSKFFSRKPPRIPNGIVIIPCCYLIQ